jgi:hypothetical protein
MMPITAAHTATDIPPITQGISTSFATVTQTATTTAADTIVKTAYTTSTTTVSAAAKCTATHLRAIVPPSLLNNAIATYTIVDEQTAAAETYAIKYALAAALTTGAALAWYIRRTPPPPAPPGVDRQRWKAIKHHVHNWLHEKLRSNVSLRRELDDARKKLGEHETRREARIDHASQTEELSEEAQAVQDGSLQQTMDFNSMSEEATLLRRELMVEKDKTTKLHQQLKETTQALKSSIARVQEVRERTSGSGIQNRESDDAEATVVLLQAQLQASKKEAISLNERLRAANRSAFDVESDLASKDKDLRVARREQDQANAVLANITTQSQVAEQEATQLKIQLGLKEEELRAAQAEIERVKHQMVSMEETLQETQQEAMDANTKVLSMNERLVKAKQEIDTAKTGTEAIEKILPDMVAEMTSLQTQLQQSRQEEEKGRTDISPLEREIHQTRLEHSKQIESLQEQLRSSGQRVGEKDPLAEEEHEVDDSLQAALNEENEYLKGQLQHEAAQRKRLVTQVIGLEKESRDLQNRLRDKIYEVEEQEERIQKLYEEIDTLEDEAEAAHSSKSFNSIGTQTVPTTTAPPTTSFSSSGTQTSPTTNQPQAPPLLQPTQTPQSPPYLLSVAGATIPSTPAPASAQAPPTTPSPTPTPNSANTPDRISIARSFSAGKITLSEYMEALAALPAKTHKRKPGDLEETPRPTKKPKSGAAATARYPVVSVLTPGGGPAFKLPVQAPIFGGGVNDSIVQDSRSSEVQKALAATTTTTTTTTEKTKTKTLAANSYGARTSLLPQRGTVDADRGPRGDMPLIIVKPATKRRLGVEDNAASDRPTRIRRVREELGGEQTSGLDELAKRGADANVADESGEMSGDGVVREGGGEEVAATMENRDSPSGAQPALTEPVAQTGKGVVNEAARPNDTHHGEAVAAIVETQGPRPEAHHTPISPANQNNNIPINDSNKPEASSTTKVPKPAPAPAQPGRRQSRLPVPAPATGIRKSTRNAGKLAVSYKESDLVRRSASPAKVTGGKGPDGSPGKQSAKPPVKDSTKTPAKSPAKPRASRSPSKGKGRK